MYNNNDVNALVKFTHNSYGEMTTSVVSWIEYLIFDAWSEKYESCVVNKDDCSNPIVETY